MSPIRVEAIQPKRFISGEESQKLFNRYLRDFAREIKREMKEYPPPLPWKNKPPRTGPRAGGKRTGQYKRGWDAPAIFNPGSVSIVNTVSYAVQIGGPKGGSRGNKQTRVAASRGWKSISDIAPEVNRRVLPRLSVAFTAAGARRLSRG